MLHQSEYIIKEFWNTIPKSEIDWEKELDTLTYNNFLKLSMFYDVPIFENSKILTKHIVKETMVRHIIDYIESQGEIGFNIMIEDGKKRYFVDILWLIACWQNNYPKSFNLYNTYGFKKKKNEMAINFCQAITVLGLLLIIIKVLSSFF